MFETYTSFTSKRVGGYDFYYSGNMNDQFDLYIDLSLTTKIYVNGRTGIEILNIEDLII